MNEDGQSSVQRYGALSRGKAKLIEMLLERKSRTVENIHRLTRSDDSSHWVLPASFAQQRMWFIEQLEASRSPYRIATALRLRGDLDIAALRKALDVVIQRHEVLRTSFVNEDGQPKQRVARDARFTLLEFDITGNAADDRQYAIRSHKDDEFRSNLDLCAGPLTRGRLLRLGSKEHVLILTMHHIVSDGWSMGVLIYELAELYNAFREGRENPLRPLRIQYADYANWQRQWLKDDILERQLRYWQDRLLGAPPQLELPTDRPRPPIQSYRGESIAIALDSELTRGLKAFAQELGITLFITLYAGWAVLLSRLCGSEDVVIGTPVANRSRPELEDLIGLFVNTVVLRVDVKAEDRLSKFIKQIKEVTLGAYDHQDMPFEQVVEALRPQRTLDRNPIFQVMLALHNTADREQQFSGLVASIEGGFQEPAKFDLLLWLEERDGGIRGTLTYASDIFDRSTVERWSNSLTILLGAMIGNAQVRVGDLPIIDERGRDIVRAYGAPQADYAQHLLLHELFERQVQRTPSAVALRFELRSMTYADLNGRANRLARLLKMQGVGPDQLVGLCVERGFNLIVGILGILKSGGAYVPLDPSYPTARIRFTLEDAAPRVLITDGQHRDRFSELVLQTIALDDDGDVLARYSDHDLKDEADEFSRRQLAYVIYTSGSTGVPKGVMVEHGNVTRLFAATARELEFSERDVWTLFHSYAFDFSVWEIWGALLYGGRLLIVPQAIARSPIEFYRLVCDESVTILNQTPSAFSQVIDAECGSDRRHSLRAVIFGGEALDSRMLVPWAARNGLERPQLINMYGITETTVHVTFHRITSLSDSPDRDRSIGRPLPDLSLYVLDQFRHLVPVGVAGEMYVGGAGVSLGYLNRPELTAERFVSDVLEVGGQERLYKTGDIGLWRSDGTLEYLGRNDSQVKIRGFRVETGEIAANLVRHGAVKDAVVTIRSDDRGDKRLVAYVVPQISSGSQTAFADGLRKHLRESLPEHMVPAAFVLLDQLPLTVNGKLDLRSLPAPSSNANLDREYQAPYGSVEEALADIWKHLLNLERVGRHDNFFDVGGHSMLAATALFRINTLFGSSLRLIDFYMSATIGELAARIEGKAVEAEFVNLECEAMLPDTIVPLQKNPEGATNNVMLTGATGFVGRFILSQLLQNTDYNVYCLVRGTSGCQVTTRLMTTMAEWELWRPEFADRVVVLRGDLCSDRLGLSNSDWQDLCVKVDAIYHCATSMNHLETYAMAKRENVDAMRELLQMATTDRPKVVNYISSLSVFSNLTSEVGRFVDEGSSIDRERHPTSAGYTASKWVAEKLVMMASERSIPCNIFRLGLVWADSHRGRYDELQHVYRVMKTSILSGFGIREYQLAMPPTPVDYVARSVVALADKHSEGGGIFHISSLAPQVGGLFERLNAVAGTGLNLLPYYEWIAEIRRLHIEGRSLSAVPLIEYAFSMGEDAFYEQQRSTERRKVQFGCDRTHRELEEAGISVPVVDDALLKVCLEDMLERDLELRQMSNVRAGRVIRSGALSRSSQM